MIQLSQESSSRSKWHSKDLIKVERVQWEKEKQASIHMTHKGFV